MMEAPLHAAASSLLTRASVEIDFYFLLHGFDAKRRDLILRSMEMSGKPYRATFLDEPNAEALAGLRPFHGNLTPYYRLFLPKMVPADRLLYLDSDTVCMLDVASLGELAMSHASGFVPAGVTAHYIERELFLSVGLPDDTPAFNSGAMLFDLAAWRDQKLTEACLSFCRTYQEYDQTALIAVSAGQFERLDPRYNIPLYTNTQAPDTDVYPGIYHFVGSPKPWDIGGRQFHSSFSIYEHALAHTVWGSHTVDYMSAAQWRRAYKVKGGYARKLLYLARHLRRRKV
jgi:lipopolysaccharide biosynthesis glycosyltransferase